MTDIERLIRPNIAALCPYSTARDECTCKLGIFLDANESPYENGWNRYPDPHQKILKARISEIKGVPASNIFLGNGSDEAIDLIFRVFCTPGTDNVISIAPSYGMYTVAAQTNDIAVREVLLGEDFSLDTDAILTAMDDNTKAIFLCSPNNPSGNAFTNEQVAELAEKSGRIVVLDEAYIDFCTEPSMIGRVNEINNLIVFQTMSKARGMAGLRLGMAFACDRIIALMSMVKYPYNINEATQKIAMRLLAEPIDSQVEEIISERERIAEAIISMPFVRKVYPSQANFLLVKVDDANSLYDHLIADGIIVRNRNKVAGCAGCLRITIGLKTENESLLKSLKKYEEGNICR